MKKQPRTKALLSDNNCYYIRIKLIRNGKDEHRKTFYKKLLTTVLTQRTAGCSRLCCF